MPRTAANGRAVGANNVPKTINTADSGAGIKFIRRSRGARYRAKCRMFFGRIGKFIRHRRHGTVDKQTGQACHQIPERGPDQTIA